METCDVWRNGSEVTKDNFFLLSLHSLYTFAGNCKKVAHC